jgi:excisionase family DNA binding protein
MSDVNLPDSVVLADWITPREAAELIRLSQQQVRHLARTGVLEARKWGRGWLIKRTSAEAYARTEHLPGPKARQSSTAG